MIAKLSKELTDALHANNNGQTEAVDPETGRVYFVVDGDIHRQAMEALRRQQDRDAIAQGIADMEAGRTQPIQAAHAKIRQDLRLQFEA